MKNFLTVILNCGLIFLITNAFSQQDNILFFMHKIPQSNFVNPAIQNECKFHIGGFLVPVTGQVLSAWHFNYSNSSFGYKDLFYYGKGDYADSIITPFHPNSLENGGLEKFIDKLHKHNYISIENHLNLFNIGYKYKDYYFTFNVNEKLNFRFSFTKDFIDFANNLNGDACGRTLDIQYGLDLMHYREYSLSASKNFNGKLLLGARYKWMFGKADLETRRNKMELYTHPISWAWQVKSDMDFRCSFPIFDIVELQYFYENDSMAFSLDSTKLPLNDSNEFDMSEFNYKKYMLNRKNFGTGFDIGAIIKLTDQIKIHASLLDMGFIRWADCSERVTSKGSITFRGIDLIPYLEEDVEVNHDSATADSLYKDFEIHESGKPYYTWFNPKLYVGGTYQIHKLIGVGVLYRTELYNSRIHSSITLSGNSTITYRNGIICKGFVFPILLCNR
ncbi:MAG: hypothetical protein HY738_22925 [Bacteroidia bacterium]|nr:hypothetical protein [Bacteroidia bacterium]